MILDFEKKWKPGQTIRIKFLNGNHGLKDKVRRNAMRWIDESGVNLKFDFDSDGDKSEVRISFGQPTDSMVGTELIDINPGTPNLYFNAFEASSFDEQKILHEFGHVLGFIHEIFHPAIPFKINYDEMKKYYMGPEGFSDAAYDANIGRKIPRNSLQYYEFDPDSIMMYMIPSNANDLGKEFPQTQDLSKDDLKYLKQVYDSDDYFKDIGNRIELDDEINESAQQKLYSFKVTEVSNNSIPTLRNANCTINISGDTPIVIALYKIVTEGRRQGLLEYVGPWGENEALGSNFDYSHDLLIGDYRLRIRHVESSGIGKYKMKFNLTKNPDE